MTKVEAGGGGNSGSQGSDEGNNEQNDPLNKHDIKDKDLRDKLDSLKKDCMGQLLITFIENPITFLTGDEAELEDWVAGRFSYDNATGESIRLQDPNNIFSLIHEMIHAFHFECFYPRSFTSAQINIEIESRLGVCLYCNRYDIPLENYSYSLGGEDGGVRTFSDLCDLYYNGISSGPKFDRTYDKAKQAIRPLYPNAQYSEAAKNFDNLKKIMKDCDKINL